MAVLRRLLAALVLGFFLSNILPLPVVASSLKIQQETWFNDLYRQGEEIIVAASLQSGGRRYASGPLLSEADFKVIFEFENGKRESLTLYDSGDRLEHGDISAGDGIWSNRFRLKQEGRVNVLITASGVLRNQDFKLKSGLGQFMVIRPGRVVITDPAEADLVFTGGRQLTLPLTVHNHSTFEETVLIELLIPVGRVKPALLVLAPQEKLELKLEVTANSPGLSEPLEVVLNFTPDSALTTVQPRQMALTVTIISAGEAVLRRLEPFRQGLNAVAVAAGIIVILFLFMGALLYIFKVRPLGSLGGVLFYRRYDEEEFKPVLTRDSPVAIEKLTINFGRPEAEADLALVFDQSAYTITVLPAWQSRLPRIIRGWQVLFTRPSPNEVLVACSPPGVLRYNEGIYSRVIMRPGEDFESGGYIFKYEALPGNKEKTEKARKDKKNPEAAEVGADQDR